MQCDKLKYTRRWYCNLAYYSVDGMQISEPKKRLSYVIICPYNPWVIWSNKPNSFQNLYKRSGSACSKPKKKNWRTWFLPHFTFFVLKLDLNCLCPMLLQLSLAHLTVHLSSGCLRLPRKKHKFVKPLKQRRYAASTKLKVTLVLASSDFILECFSCNNIQEN